MIHGPPRESDGNDRGERTHIHAVFHPARPLAERAFRGKCARSPELGLWWRSPDDSLLEDEEARRSTGATTARLARKAAAALLARVWSGMHVGLGVGIGFGFGIAIHQWNGVGSSSAAAARGVHRQKIF